MSDSYILIRLKDQLEKIISEGKDPGNLPNIVEHIKDLEIKARFSIAPKLPIAERIEKNSWDHNLDQVVDTIKECLNSDWSWSANSDCKYVGIRIDMRNGGLVITNRGDQRISIEQLKYQYGNTDVTIVVNSQEKIINSSELSYAEVVQLAYGEKSKDFIYTITYRGGDSVKPEGILMPDFSVGVMSGMIFNVTDTGNA